MRVMAATVCYQPTTYKAITRALTHFWPGEFLDAHRPLNNLITLKCDNLIWEFLEKIPIFSSYSYKNLTPRFMIHINMSRKVADKENTEFYKTLKIISLTHGMIMSRSYLLGQLTISFTDNTDIKTDQPGRYISELIN